MADTVKIALDAMGGDNAPNEIVMGAIDALNSSDKIEITLFGDGDIINKILDNNTYDKDRLKIINTSEVIDTSESPVSAITLKKDSSLVKALKAVKVKDADAFISAGNSGAILAGGQLIVGRLKGVKRAPFAPIIPTENGPSLLLDSGANVDCRKENILQFAIMGSIYMESILKRKVTVGILNIGVEEEKGNALVKESFPLLKSCDKINFIGSVEARDVVYGKADVIVCEAFAGNILLKMFEGTAQLFLKLIKRAFMSSIKAKIGAFFSVSSIKKEFKAFDVSDYGGAIMLGLKGVVVKTHGNATRKEIKNAIMQCIDFKEQNVLNNIEEVFTRT